MEKFNDSLRGYGHPIFKRDSFTCRYCGRDHSSFEMWRFLTVDHLLPKNWPDKEEREKAKWKVTACSFCNTVRNRTRYDIKPGITPAAIVKMKKKEIDKATALYQDFWEKEVNKGK